MLADALASSQRKETLSHKRMLVAILAVSVFLRVAAAVAMGNGVEDLPGTADQHSYHALAQRVLAGHGFSFGEPWWPATRANAPTAHWSYAYTFYLVGVYGLFGVNPLAARLIQAILVGLLQPLLAYRLARSLYRPDVALIGAGLMAVYAYFVYYGAALMTESFYFVAVLAALYFAVGLSGRPPGEESPAPSRTAWDLGLGLSLAAAVLLRQVIVVFIPILLAWLIVASRGRVPLGRSLRSAATAGAVLVVCILPFTLYSSARFGRFVPLNTNAGFAFFWANHPIHGTSFQSILTQANYGELLPPELRSLDEAALDRALLGRGLGFVLDDPVRYLRLSLSRVADYFMFWPTAESSLVSNVSRVASFGWLWPFMLVGAVQALRRGGSLLRAAASPAGLLTLFAFVYTSIHLLSWALVRYRLPVDAALLVFAGAAIGEAAEKVRSPWQRRMARRSQAIQAGALKE
jgi:hypothetical protein